MLRCGVCAALRERGSAGARDPLAALPPALQPPPAAALLPLYTGVCCTAIA